MQQILKQWGSPDNLMSEFTDKLMKIQGSGYGNLAYCAKSKTLEYIETKDQDPVIMVPGKIPILGIDAWEHSWYLKYKNEKKKYCTEIWKIVNWKDLEQRFGAAIKH
jgi:Fe-Mn family superoxide dismutase